VTPQLLQDYQSEIERLKFRLRKRKGKMEKLKEEVLHQKDLADSAKKSCTKYEKEVKRMHRDMAEALEKEMARRKKTEQMAKSLQRKIGELEFLLENEASMEEASPDNDDVDDNNLEIGRQSN
jgi:peptidoglycan hydrolase CwlO-like protein